MEVKQIYKEESNRILGLGAMGCREALTCRALLATLKSLVVT